MGESHKETVRRGCTSKYERGSTGIGEMVEFLIPVAGRARYTEERGLSMDELSVAVRLK